MDRVKSDGTGHAGDRQGLAVSTVRTESVHGRDVHQTAKEGGAAADVGEALGSEAIDAEATG